MKSKRSFILAVLGLMAAVAMGGGVVLAGGRLPDGLAGLLTGLAGALAGVSGSALVMQLVSLRCTPEQRKELERGERDERNAAIRERAAQSSWYWSLSLLWVLFFVTLILGDEVYIALASGVIVLHCAFYMVNIGRWAKRM